MLRLRLPKDAEYKGCEAVVVQDLQIHLNNVRFYEEKYYSASRHKTYLAELPPAISSLSTLSERGKGLPIKA
jgi:hypothetical protein